MIIPKKNNIFNSNNSAATAARNFNIFKYNKKISIHDNMWLFCKFIQNELGSMGYTHRSISECPIKFRILCLIIIQDFEFTGIDYTSELRKLMEIIKQCDWSLAKVLRIINLIEEKSRKRLEHYLLRNSSICEINSDYTSVKTCLNGILSTNLFGYLV